MLPVACIAWPVACIVGVLLGRTSGVLLHGILDLFTIYSHTPPQTKHQWLVIVHVFYKTRVCVCESRFSANVLFGALNSPRVLINTHQRSRDGSVREVLYGGAITGRMLKVMRRELSVCT